jgi:hypothetical protein
MTMERVTAIPEGSTVSKGFGEVHFHDSYLIAVQTDKSAAEITRELIQLPSWAGWLLSLRNAIAALFSLKTGRPLTTFPVMWQTDSEIVTGMSDRHLDFRVSILKNPAADTVSFTTIVHFNNIWGRLYFLPVRPFHTLIVKTLLCNYLRNNQ